MPRRDHRKLKPKTSTTCSNVLKSEQHVSNIDTDTLDKVFHAIPDMVDSIMIKIAETKEEPAECKQTKLEKEVTTIKNNVESIKYDVMEILRQLSLRDRKPPTLGDALGNLFSGIEEDVTFQNIPYTKKTTTYQTPTNNWRAIINEIEGKFSNDEDSDSD